MAVTFSVDIELWIVSYLHFVKEKWIIRSFCQNFYIGHSC